MCDFEDNAQPICSWTHDDTADFLWQRVQGDEMIENGSDDEFWQTYGIDRDHTLGKSMRKLLVNKQYVYCWIDF